MAELKDPRKEFADILRGMYDKGSLDASQIMGGLSEDMRDRAGALGIDNKSLDRFISKLGTPVERLRRENAARRQDRAEAIKRARQPDAVSGREPMRTSLVVTGLRDEFGNPYTRSLDTPGAQARRDIRAAEAAGDRQTAAAARQDPDARADRGRRTQDDAQVDRAREIQKKKDADKAEGAAEKNVGDAEKTGKDLKQAIKKLKQERKQAKFKNR
tara:strand:+ start:7017 stop:7661 length:645 start_codon:yes stop_codon:yes gene_type:complete